MGHIAELIRPVGVTIGRKQCAKPAGPGHQLRGYIHAVEVAIDLQSRSGLGRRTSNQIEVEFDRWPDSDSPAGEMGYDIDPRVGDGIQEAPGLLLSLKSEIRVDCGDGEIEPVENRVGKVEVAVAIDIEL